MKQMQMWASMRFSVKWNMGLASRLPFVIRKARSTTQSPWYCSTTSAGFRSVFVIFPFSPSHAAASAIFSSLMMISTSLLISRNLLYPRLFTCDFVILPLFALVNEIHFKLATITAKPLAGLTT